MDIRAASPDDGHFLLEMALLAAFPPGPLPEGAADLPRLTRWTDGWGRAGDVGVIAWVEGERAGAAWCRLQEVSIAFDEQGRPLPELAIAVVPEQRSRGIGAQLLRALQVRATQAGHRELSLTVNVTNPARRLYEREGYRVIARAGDTLTMTRRTPVLTLRREAAGAKHGAAPGR